MNNLIVEKAKQFVINELDLKLDDKFQYHNKEHTLNVIEIAEQLADACSLNEDDKEIVCLGAIFHDVGYTISVSNHEEEGVVIARKWLTARAYPEHKIKAIEDCIMATKMCGRDPNNLLQKIIKDADCAHLGTNNAEDISNMVRNEIAHVHGISFNNLDWLKNNLKFFKSHQYYTREAEARFGIKKRENIKKMEQMIAEEDKKSGKKPAKVKKEKKRTYGRGVETMYRVSLRNHNNLSRIADSKANIMLSITAIMISLVLSSLAPKIDTNPSLLIPTILIVVVCIVSMIFAILATRPKVTKSNFSRQKLLDGNFNPLFFGNFHDLSLDDFEWSLNQLIDDTELLYQSLTKDLYFLGIVLAKKYRYLRICYTIFMFGLTISVISFIIAFI